jgi:glycosyltransferase involved in cell wall biosynthesis
MHLLVPDGIDDPARPSGGNTFDRRLARGLAARGWAVDVHAVPGSWPRPDAASSAALADLLAEIPDGALVMIDGLVGSAAPQVVVPAADRLRLVLLVHMPLGYGACAHEVREAERAVLSAAEAVVTTSGWTRRVLLQLYSLRGERVHVAEPGVDPAELAQGTPTAGSLLSVAAVIPSKGHDILLDALAMLRDSRWRCLCVGSVERDPKFAETLRRRAVEAGLDGRVRFPGPRTGAALARSYRSADLLVLPSRGETYGMVVTEALARGLPVLATEVGGVPEALGYGDDGVRPGLLVPPDDPAALRDALRSWLEDAGVRRQLRTAARQRRASLSRWSTTTSRVAEVLTAVTG